MKTRTIHNPANSAQWARYCKSMVIFLWKINGKEQQPQVPLTTIFFFEGRMNALDATPQALCRIDESTKRSRSTKARTVDWYESIIIMYMVARGTLVDLRLHTYISWIYSLHMYICVHAHYALALVTVRVGHDCKESLF